MAHTQFGGPLTHFDGGVGGNQHEVALPVPAYGLQNLKTLHVGQAVIQHDHLRCQACSLLDTTGTVVGNMNFQALRLQVRLQVLRKSLFVIDYQYSVHQGRLPRTARLPGLRSAASIRLEQASCQA
ncbi:hypothetical protein D3C79_461010 [compost metagenome]